jgi:hypothetical protein
MYQKAAQNWALDYFEDYLKIEIAKGSNGHIVNTRFYIQSINKDRRKAMRERLYR